MVDMTECIHCKDVVRLETVRAIYNEAVAKIGASAVSKDPIGQILLSALENVGERNHGFNRAVLGIGASSGSPALTQASE